MEISKYTTEFNTERRFDIMEITEIVEEWVADSDLSNGLLYVYTSHTTAVVSTNEYEWRLVEDMIDVFEELVPPDNGYRHDRHHLAQNTQKNAYAHIICSMIKNTVLIPLINGELDLGRWEEIILFDLDGPNQRTVNMALYY